MATFQFNQQERHIFDAITSALTKVVESELGRSAILEQLRFSIGQVRLSAPGVERLHLRSKRVQLDMGDREVFSATPEVVCAALHCPYGVWPAKGDSYVEASFDEMKGSFSVYVGSHENFIATRHIWQAAHFNFIRVAASNCQGQLPWLNQGANNGEDDAIILTNIPSRVVIALEDVTGLVAEEGARNTGKSHIRTREGITNESAAKAFSVSGKSAANNEMWKALADRDETEIQSRSDIGATFKRVLIDARRGQGLFRARVIELEKRCRVTGVDSEIHLRASHIKPWSFATDHERLDGNNGLLLAPHVDHLFDRGFISFADCGNLLIKPSCSSSLLSAWGVAFPKNVGPFSALQSMYLKIHRKHFNFGE